MNKFPLLLCALAISTATLAQEHSGTIRYEEVVRIGDDEEMKKELQDAPADILKFIPRETKIQKVLSYTDKASLYEQDKNNTESRDKNMNADGMQLQIHFEIPEHKIYTDMAQKKVVSLQEFMSRKFLIESSFAARNWKTTGRQKKILNYPCMEAVSTADKDTVTAWFTSSIPVSAGPDGLAGLPGMILEVSKGKHHTIQAVAVDEGKVDAAAIKEPRGGKKVTKEEFESIVKNKTEEMEKEMGGKGNMIFRVETR